MKTIRVHFERKAEVWLTGHVDIEVELVDEADEDQFVRDQAETLLMLGRVAFEPDLQSIEPVESAMIVEYHTL